MQCDSDGSSLPLVLLPGTLCDARVFQPLLDRLPGVAKHTVLFPQQTTMRAAAEAVLAEAPNDFALLGFSLGGMVAMEMALCAPERVRGLALISTIASPVHPELHPARREAVQQAQCLGMRSFVRERLWPSYCGASGDAALSILMEDMAEAVGQMAYAQQTELALGRREYRSRLGGVQCPALVLAGAEDRLCPPTAQEELAAALANSRLIMLPGTGHMALLEKPDDVAAAVAAWFHTVCETG